jgi:hypothetical protein
MELVNRVRVYRAVHELPPVTGTPKKTPCGSGRGITYQQEQIGMTFKTPANFYPVK